MSDDNGFGFDDFLFGLGLGYLLKSRSAQRARQEKGWEKEQLQLDKLIAKDRGQTLDEYREWLKQQVPEKPNTDFTSSIWYWCLAFLFWAVIITLLIIYPVETIVITLALIIFLAFLGTLLALVI